MGYGWRSARRKDLIFDMRHTGGRFPVKDYVFIALFFFTAVQTGCAMAASRRDNLVRNVEHYHDGLRWRRYEDAAQHIAPKDREAFLDQSEKWDKELRIVDFEVPRVKWQAGGTQALVQIKVTWYRESQGIIHHTLLEQSWRSQGTLWQVQHEVVKDGKRLLILPKASLQKAEQPTL